MRGIGEIALLLGTLAVLGGCAETQWEEELALATVPQASTLGTARVHDINTRPVRFPQLWPSSAALTSSVTIFVASDDLHGEELWRSDGTEAGTSLVKELAPGMLGSAPQHLLPAQGLVFFTALGDSMEESLWKTDGTPAGTVRVKRFPLRIDEARGIQALAQANGTVFFRYHEQLWKSDGTEAGTVFLQQLASSPNNSSRLELRTVGNTLFFTALSAEGYLELWKLDAGGGGTVRLQTFPALLPWESSGRLTAVGSTLFFSVGKTLWKSDGTEAGTLPVSVLSCGISEMAAVNGTLFFTPCASALWKSDGTTTSLVRSFDGGARTLTPHGGALYFSGGEASSGHELWTSDGTTAGTRLVKELLAGTEGSNPRELFSWNGALYFVASATAGSRGLWRSDGTAAGTTALKTWAESTDFPWSDNDHALTGMGSVVLFAVPETPQDWPRLTWRTTGTVKGTRELAGVWTGTQSSQTRRNPIAVVGGTLFFVASDGNPGEALWRSDGTEAGTFLLRALAQVAPEQDYYTPRHNPQAVRVGNTLFFTADDGVHGLELWKSDGTAVGTVQVKDIRPGADSSYLYGLTELNGAVFFAAYDDTQGMSLWRSDGTEAGTLLVKSMGTSGYLEDLTTMGGLLYFAAHDGIQGAGLWKSDGTPEGTALVQVPLAGAYEGLTAVNGTLFLAAGDGYGLRQLWKSDGTAAGTVLVRSGFDALVVFQRVKNQNLLYFLADDGIHGYEPWRSDGTEAGTFLLKDIHPGAESSSAHGFTPVSAGLVFAAYEELHGWELWKTDGTEAGTFLLEELRPGPECGVRSTNPENLPVDFLGVEDRGLALFTGVDDAGGAELWQTDGTEAGTFQLLDLVPGPGSSEPGSFARMGDRLFFMAGDQAHGREPRLLAFPRALGSAMGTPLFQGSTCAALNQVTPSCTNNPLAPDSSFAWTAPFAGTFTFTTEGSGYDTNLEVSDPVSGASLGCNDDTAETLQSSVSVSLSAGQGVIITVDGFDTECGPFLLHITP